MGTRGGVEVKDVVFRPKPMIYRLPILQLRGVLAKTKAAHEFHWGSTGIGV